MQNIQPIMNPSSICEIRECPQTHHKSLHAVVEFTPGQIVINFSAQEILDCPNYLTVQISSSQHLMLEPALLQSINHSCDPNIFLDTQNMAIIALKPIEPGEELRFFYPSTEWSMDRGFDCICQSHNCLRTIKGAAHLSREILTQYKLSDYIQQKLGISR